MKKLVLLMIFASSFACKLVSYEYSHRALPDEGCLDVCRSVIRDITYTNLKARIAIGKGYGENPKPNRCTYHFNNGLRSHDLAVGRMAANRNNCMNRITTRTGPLNSDGTKTCYCVIQ